jgi:hypothetical protein
MFALVRVPTDTHGTHHYAALQARKDPVKTKIPERPFDGVLLELPGHFIYHMRIYVRLWFLWLYMVFTVEMRGMLIPVRREVRQGRQDGAQLDPLDQGHGREGHDPRRRVWMRPV